MSRTLPMELINNIMSYMSSPTARLIKNFTEQVEKEWIEEMEYQGDDWEYDKETDFRFAIWSNYETLMIRRYCITDDGIYRQGCVICDSYEPNCPDYDYIVVDDNDD